MTRSNLSLSLVIKLLILSLPFSQLSWAQDQSTDHDGTATYEVSTEADSEEYEFSQAELDQLLAPIALYPDTILSHILVASTYPLEVVQAARWSKNNKKPEGNVALEAADSEDWAPSVKALVQFPDLIQKMSEDLTWIQQLGDAFLQDEETVLATVQNLRQQARSEGSLDDIKHLHVSDDEGDIIIEPVTREVVYVPYYDSRVVYGSWWWPNFPPVYWHFPRIHHNLSLGHHFLWGTGIYVGTGIYFSSFHWRNRHVSVIDYRRHRNYRFRNGRSLVRHVDARRWRHNPRHRRGVSYRSTRVRHRAFSERRHQRQASVTRDRLRQSNINQRLRHRSTNQERTHRANNPRRGNSDNRNLRSTNQRREANQRAQNNQHREQRNRNQRNDEHRNREQRANRQTRAENNHIRQNHESRRQQANRREQPRPQRNDRNQSQRNQSRSDKASANRGYVKLRNNSQRANTRNSNYRNNRSTGRRSDHRRSNRSSGHRSSRGKGDRR